ncbi:MAG: dihydroneopterin aldolase, partial [Lachnospiraceae bacterium]|nr:dihydroneopterin aldolase [Lachnospiraceae bacterium]
MFTDEIRIEDLEVYAHHGVFPAENSLGQRFFVNAILYTNTREASVDDDLTRSTDYGSVAHFIHEYLQKHTYKLIETAANRLAIALLGEYPLIHHLDLEIRKPEAPIGLSFTSVSVKITRGWKSVAIAIGANEG